MSRAACAAFFTLASSSRSIRFKVFSRATVIRLRRGYGGRVASGYKCVREQTKTILEKATWAASFRRVGWDFRPALWAKSECAGHCRESRSCAPLFLLRKILSEVTPVPQQLDGATHQAVLLNSLARATGWTADPSI